MTTRNLSLILAGAVLVGGTTLALAGPLGRSGGGMRGNGVCDGSGPGAQAGGMHGHGMHGQGMHGQGMRGQGMGPGPLGMMGGALQHLGLSEEQQTRIQAIVDEARPTLDSLREQLQTSREAFREANPPTNFNEAAIRAHVAQQSSLHADLAVAAAKMRAQVLAVLTPEQLAKLEEMRQQMKDHRDGRMGGDPDGFGGGPNW